VAALLGLCRLDHWLLEETGVPGIALFPVLVAFTVLATGEVLHLTTLGGARPAAWSAYVGSLLVVTGSWIGPVFCQPDGDASGELAQSPIDWTSVCLATAVIVVFLAEMCRYREPGGVTTNVATGVFAVVYVGLLSSFLIQLRLRWGLWSVLSLLIVVKMADTGAYTVGRLIGRTKMAPRLSPGKTMEGAAGALLFACASSYVTFAWLIPKLGSGDRPSGVSWGWLGYGLVIGLIGMAGDLAESLIKRDVASKDSSHWMPGFGGVLDMLDSVLVAAPVAYALWAFGLVP
jgi:phosphatidate cytidylyltransferase